MNVDDKIFFSSKELKDLQIEHSLDVSPYTGAVSATVTLPLTPGRSGFGPELILNHQASSTESLYGMGWSLSGPSSISIYTKKRLPKYDQTDTFAFNGSDELVPFMENVGGNWSWRVRSTAHYWIYDYRQKYERDYMRFEKWVHKNTRKIHWRMRSKSNVVSIYGLRDDGLTKIMDPDNDTRIFSWLLEAQYDSNGNAIIYDYVSDQKNEINSQPIYEYQRLKNTQGLAQRYLKRILYGNTKSLKPDQAVPITNTWLYQVVMDYGDHSDDPLPSYLPDQPWKVRTNPFSTYRQGFELRTYRQCKRVLMFHHFKNDLGADPFLVSAIRLNQEDHISGTLLRSVEYVGYKKRMPHLAEVVHRTLPPLTFEYSSSDVERKFNCSYLNAEANVPYGLGSSKYRWFDLYGEGLPGILYESNDVWYYKSNEGKGRFAFQSKVYSKPSELVGSYSLSDFDGNGNPNLMVNQGGQTGFCEYTRDESQWESFKAFRQSPSVDEKDSVQWLDMNGNGWSDMVITKQDRFTWYPSKGKDGFDSAIEFFKPSKEDVSLEAIDHNAEDLFLADMTGDGLVDQVRIRNGRIEYWPHMGYGCFGDGVVMADAPIFDDNALFDSRRILFANISGNGGSDILYVGRGEIRYWINVGGNRWEEGDKITGLPFIDQLSSLRVLDLLGNGTSCLVWSTTQVSHSGCPLQYLQLNQGVKPHLLTQMDNSMGKVVRLKYGSSAEHYLRDKKNGRGWISTIPNHPIVVNKKEVIDEITQSTLTSRYEYHDGYFDGALREFKGFTCVDHYDSEYFDQQGPLSQEQFTQPVCTRTWYHNGACAIHEQQKDQFYAQDFQHQFLDHPQYEHLLDGTGKSFSEGFKVLSGQITRQETYAVEDDQSLKVHPIQVLQYAYRIRQIQAMENSFDFFQSENLEYHYEQESNDPRLIHQLNLEVDSFGNQTVQCEVAYPRRPNIPNTYSIQEKYYIKVSQLEWKNIDVDNVYYGGVPLDAKEFTLYNLSSGGNLFDYTALKGTVGGVLQNPLNFEEALPQDPAQTVARLETWKRSFYWNNQRSDVLPYGQVGSKVLVHHREDAVFNSALIQSVFQGDVDQQLLEDDGLFVFHDGYWWQADNIQYYHPQAKFNLLIREEGPDGGVFRYVYDPPYYISIKQVTDAMGNQTQAKIDYQTLSPYEIKDMNDNIAQVVYDPFGMVIVSTSFGNILDRNGAVQSAGNDPMDTYQVQADESFMNVVDEPERFLQRHSSYLYYELDTWTQLRQPLRSIHLSREKFVHDGQGHISPVTPIQLFVTYRDGEGESLQTKQKVESGLAIKRDLNDAVVVDIEGYVEHEYSQERWHVSGHTVYNNKRLKVKEYEPFYSTLYTFESDITLRTFGVSAFIYYDGMAREYKKVMPNQTWVKREWKAWVNRAFDQIDTVDDSDYRLYRDLLPNNDLEKKALDKAMMHAQTPTDFYLDAKGREVITVEMSSDGNHRMVTKRLSTHDYEREVTDGRGIKVFEYLHDMMGRVLWQKSVDAGELKQVSNAFGQKTHQWDGLGQHVFNTYDVLSRLSSVYVSGGAQGFDHLVERLKYGESGSQYQVKHKNVRGQLIEHYDQAGVTFTHRYTMQGQLIYTERQFLDGYEQLPNWNNAMVLNPNKYMSWRDYNALGNVISKHLPDNTYRKFEYSSMGGSKKISLETPNGVVQDYLKDAKYNAKGQRTKSVLGNNIERAFEYDPETFFLSKQVVVKKSINIGHGDKTLSDVRYTYDAGGNLIYMNDLVQQPNTHYNLIQGHTVSAHNEFTYDSFNQLKIATGRVHQVLLQRDDQNIHPGSIRGTRHIHFNDGNLLERYTRQYDYDLSGNIQSIHHLGFSHQWTQENWTSAHSNRSLPKNNVQGNPLANPEQYFDANGNTTYLPHLRKVDWNERNNIRHVVLIDRSAQGQPNDEEFYVYDSEGIRVRKVTKILDHGEVVKTETFYLEDCEVKRVTRGGQLRLDRTVSHIMDDAERMATLYRWDNDELGTETDDINLDKIHYSISNNTSSTSLELNQQGDVINYEEYFPFGTTSFVISDDVRVIKRKDYRYHGKERDDLTGLYYFGYRYYAPWIGNWLSPDPIGPEDSLNLYLFLHNNPNKFEDADGTQSLLKKLTESTPEDCSRCYHHKDEEKPMLRMDQVEELLAQPPSQRELFVEAVFNFRAPQIIIGSTDEQKASMSSQELRAAEWEAKHKVIHEMMSQGQREAFAFLAYLISLPVVGTYVSEVAIARFGMHAVTAEVMGEGALLLTERSIRYGIANESFEKVTTFDRYDALGFGLAGFGGGIRQLSRMQADQALRRNVELLENSTNNTNLRRLLEAGGESARAQMSEVLLDRPALAELPQNFVEPNLESILKGFDDVLSTTKAQNAKGMAPVKRVVEGLKDGSIRVELHNEFDRAFRETHGISEGAVAFHRNGEIHILKEYGRAPLDVIVHEGTHALEGKSFLDSISFQRIYEKPPDLGIIHQNFKAALDRIEFRAHWNQNNFLSAIGGKTMVKKPRDLLRRVMQVYGKQHTKMAAEIAEAAKQSMVSN